MTRSIADLTAQEIIAFAIDTEKNNAERYDVFSNLYSDYNSDIHELFLQLKKEELQHLKVLQNKWLQKYGDAALPDVKEYEVVEVIEAIDLNHGEHLLFDDVLLKDAVQMALISEKSARLFYNIAAATTPDSELRTLFMELEEFEIGHVNRLEMLINDILGDLNAQE
jgi:rubrerythrin